MLIDSSPPVTTSDVDSSWHSRPVTLTLSARDDRSGVLGTFMIVNGEGPLPYHGPFQIGEDGVNSVGFWSIDTAGNVEPAVWIKIKVSTKRPATNVRLSGTTQPTSAWRSGPVTVSLEPTSAAVPVASTYFRVGDSAPITYTAPFAIATEGTTTVDFWSVDAEGTAEATQSLQVFIDGTAPLTSAHGVPDGWVSSEAIVTLGASDRHSGVAATYYTLDGGETTAYTGPLSITRPGVTLLRAWSVDAAGNTETPSEVEVKVMTNVSAELAASAQVVPFNRWVKLSGQLDGVADVRVSLQASQDGIRWKTVKSILVNSAGAFATWQRIPARTYLRFVFPGAPGFAATTSNAVTVTSSAWITPPSTPTVVRRGQAFASVGYLKPRHRRGSWNVRIYGYRYERKRWVLRYRGSAVNHDYHWYTSYYRRVYLPYAGRWRLRAYHSDSDHAGTWSAYRYLEVR